MPRITAVILLTLAALAAPARAQSFLGFFVSPPDSARGFRINGATLSSGYYSAITPFGSATLIGPATPVFGADVSNTFSASLSYHRRSPTSNFEITYTPSYERYWRNSQLNMLSHDLTITTSRPLQLSRRVSLDISGSGDVTNTRQYLFNMGSLNRAAGASSTFDELAGSTLGTPTATGAASLPAVSAPTLDSAAEQLFFGDRVLMAGLQATFAYAWSPRLHVGVTLGGSRYQHLGGQDTLAAMPQSAFLLAQATTAIGGVTAYYSLSPRTQIGGEVTTTRNFSRLQQGFVTTSTFTIGRKMGPHWFAQAKGGVGLLNVNGDKSDSSKQPQYLAGATLGIKTRAHTFMLSPERTITSAFGVAYNTTDVQAAWMWQSRARTWQLSSGAGYQRFVDTAISKVNAWRGAIAAGRRLGSQFVAQVQFSQMSYSARLELAPYRLSQRGVLLSLSWAPSARFSEPAAVGQ